MTYLYAPDDTPPGVHDCKVADAVTGDTEPPRWWTCPRCGITWRRYDGTGGLLHFTDRS